MFKIVLFRVIEQHSNGEFWLLLEIKDLLVYLLARRRRWASVVGWRWLGQRQNWAMLMDITFFIKYKLRLVCKNQELKILIGEKFFPNLQFFKFAKSNIFFIKQADSWFQPSMWIILTPPEFLEATKTTEISSTSIFVLSSLKYY